jgi:hypothetical protein
VNPLRSVCPDREMEALECGVVVLILGTIVPNSGTAHTVARSVRAPGFEIPTPLLRHAAAVGGLADRFQERVQNLG